MSKIKEGCYKTGLYVSVKLVPECGRHLVRVRRRRRRAYAPTSNTSSHFYIDEKSDLRVSMSMGLHLASLRVAGAPL